MNKRAAGVFLRENEITIGQLRKAIAQTRGARAMSIVNSQFELDAVLDMFGHFVDGKEDGQVIDAYGRDAVSAKNIIRECM